MAFTSETPWHFITMPLPALPDARMIRVSGRHPGDRHSVPFNRCAVAVERVAEHADARADFMDTDICQLRM
jgi:hypothetical protein